MISTRTYFSQYVVLILVSTSYLFLCLRIPKLSTRRSLYRLRRGFENRKRKYCFYFLCLGILINILSGFDTLAILINQGKRIKIVK